MAKKTNVMNGVARKTKAYIRGSDEDVKPIDKYSNVAVADITAYKM